MRAEEAPYLHEFLLLAIHVPEGSDPPVPSLIDSEPNLRCYHENWGRASDVAVLAENASGDIVGASWVRQMNPDQPGYGYINVSTRSLAIAVRPERRGQGIGTLLLDALLSEVEGIPVSLSVAEGNRAARLYARKGFEIIQENKGELIMLRRG
ncbi:MAG: GNAT family N-acetyltransferase [Cyanobacteria bacterium P01_F01_bin.42]